MVVNVPTEIERERIGGERLLWTGQPDPGRHFERSDRFLIPFTLMWGGFAIFWLIGAIMSGASPFFFMWGIPFVAIGVYMIVGRFFVKARTKRRTYYAVTDRRVLSVVRGGQTKAMFLNLIPTINARIRDDGSGTVIFGNTSWLHASYGNTGAEFFGQGYDADVVAFYDISDAREVVDLVNELRSRQDPKNAESQGQDTGFAQRTR
jgi:hypothetical protein